VKYAVDCTVRCTAVVLRPQCDLRRALYEAHSRCLRTFKLVLSDRGVVLSISFVEVLSPVFTHLIRIFQIGPCCTLYVVITIIVGVVVVVVEVVGIVKAVLLVVYAMVQRIETPSLARHEHHKSCSPSKELCYCRKKVREYKSQRNAILHRRSTTAATLNPDLILADLGPRRLVGLNFLQCKRMTTPIIHITNTVTPLDTFFQSD